VTIVRAVSLPPEFRAAVGRVLPAGGVISEPAQLRTYECDALTGHRAIPELVVLPETAEQVRELVASCHAHRVPFVARGAGTGLSGGALPVADGVVIALTRLNRVLEVDLDRGVVVVEPGVTNLDVTRAVAAEGFFYAPDPSSQQVCTIGGNVAENSGGAHCLKYGFTVNHVLAADIVLPTGELVTISRDDDGPDLLGVFVGSEGTLGIAVRVTVRVLRAPETVRTLLAAFATTDAAGDAVSHVIAAGILPAAIELMDALTLEAVEAAVAPGYPAGAGAVLIVELDGPAAQALEDSIAVERICRDAGAFEVRAAEDAEERARIWRGRKSSFAAMGRISPSYYVQDGVVPRTRLPEVLRRINVLGEEYGLRIASVFHAGDGNLHPLVLYDEDVPGEAARAEELATAILDVCIEAGGSLTGEHGVGVDKACSMPKLFSEDDLATMARLRSAFDPEGLANPGKVFPTPRLCGEVPGPYRTHPLERAGLAERL
jgi:glycolate dehydrogenase FAD-linked subunit